MSWCVALGDYGNTVERGCPPGEHILTKDLGNIPQAFEGFPTYII
jgi:hypothetical protein